MRRRDFLAMSGAIAGTFAARPVFGQGGDVRVRAAVVIGVNKTGDLPVLSAAASGARMFATWLELEGFEVKLLVDDANPVLARDIFKAVDALVRRGNLDQLVVYFSGHGFLISPTSEYWMLSEAPNNPNEAVSLLESITHARASGIPNVVFISDACRSKADTIRATGVRGSIIFPNLNVTQMRADVDKFLATLPGDPAHELPVQASVVEFEGIYTSCFLEAFRRPDATMVRTVSNGIDVVPNRRLKPYLVREVRRKIEAKSMKLRQIPDAEVNSDDDAYIGRVAVRPSLPPPGPPPKATIFDVAELALERVGATTLSTVNRPDAVLADVARAAAETGFASAESTIRNALKSRSFETKTGFIVSGTRLRSAVAAQGLHTDIGSDGDGALGTEIVWMRPDGHWRAGSVALHFADGSGAVIAALAVYVANVVVESGRVINVSYVPALNDWRWSEYQQNRDLVDRLHAAVASAARYGVFRIEGEKANRNLQAEQLADRIRLLKNIDPTLGLYAAYAYADADLLHKVRSVRDIMRHDLHTDMFDIAMLAGALSGRRIDDDPAVPFCPMLSQGWTLLRVKDVRLPPKIDAARDHLRASLWTTFTPRGMELVMEAMHVGRLH